MRAGPSISRPAGISRCAWFLLLNVLAVPRAANAETVAESYAKANQDYLAGNYQSAARRLERLVAIPLHHADIFYNLGNAYFRLGKLGPAIYNYERSLMLQPGREDSAFNLKVARRVAAAGVKDVLEGAQRESALRRWLSQLSIASWRTAFLTCWWLLFVILLVLRRVDAGALRSGLIAGAVFVAMLASVSGASLLGRVRNEHVHRAGVILPQQVPVREGPALAAKSNFKVHAGLKVELRGETDDWLRVRLANGLEGWVLRREIGLL